MQSKLERFFDRIGYKGPAAPTLSVLRDLHYLYPKAIPFENLNQVLGESCSLDPDWIFDKMVMQKRGGWCYEHCILFGKMLEVLGFNVEYHLSRIIWHRPTDPEARLHAVLSVNINGERYLCDVGYGRFTATAPVSLDTEETQHTSHDTYRIRDAKHGSIVEMLSSSEWRAAYQLDDRPLVKADFEVCDHFLRTHPSSLFTNNVIAVGVTDDARLSLRNEDFTVRSIDGQEKRQEVTSKTLTSILTGYFGIDLPNVNKNKLCSTFERLVDK